MTISLWAQSQDSRQTESANGQERTFENFPESGRWRLEFRTSDEGALHASLAH